MKRPLIFIIFIFFLSLALGRISYAASPDKENDNIWKVCKNGDTLSVQTHCPSDTVSAAELFELANQACTKGENGKRGVTGPVGLTGNPGDTGPQGPAGPQGADGTSLFATLPPGAEITGHFAREYDFIPTKNTTFFQTLVTFSNRLPNELASSDIFILKDGFILFGSQEKSRCLGSFAAPSASAGTLCIYLLSSENASDFLSKPLGNIGFSVNWNVVQPGFTSVKGAWAYHAE